MRLMMVVRQVACCDGYQRRSWLIVPCCMRATRVRKRRFLVWIGFWFGLTGAVSVSFFFRASVVFGWVSGRPFLFSCRK